MFIYFIVFVIAFIFLIIAQELFKKGNKKLGILLSIITIIILSLLAGLRTKMIGDDTKSYVQTIYEATLRQKNLSSTINLLVFNSHHDFLYVIINYIVCRLNFSINSLYFLLEFIPLLFIYMACYDNKDNKGNYALYFICFVLLFFNKSLNMCRQTISIAILIYAFKYAINKKTVKYFLLGIIATGFHITAIIFIPTYLLTRIISNSNKDFKKIFLLLLLMISIFKYQSIINFLVLKVNLLDQKYLYYINNSIGLENVPLLEFIFILTIGILCVILYYKKKNQLKEKEKIYIFYLIMTPIIYSLGIIGNYAFRFSYYFYYYIIFVIPLFRMIFKDNNSKKIINIVIIMSLFIYSYLYYDYIGYDHTTPYQSIISENK